MMAEHLIFLGDIKGTKSALENDTGRAILVRRLEKLHDNFAATFSEFSSRSRSLTAVTISDSVFACWSDVREGLRFAVPFMKSLWRRLDQEGGVRFRGFLDIGEFIPETSILGFGLELVSDRFVRVLPPSVALWSVAVAEAAHLPDGMFISQRLIARLPDVRLFSTAYHVTPFEYRKMAIE